MNSRRFNSQEAKTFSDWLILRPTVSDRTIDALLAEGSVVIDLKPYLPDAHQILKAGCQEYSKSLSHVFAFSEKHFLESQFRVVFDENEIHPEHPFERTLGAAKSRLFTIVKEVKSMDVTVSLLVEKDKIKIPKELIRRILAEAVREILFGHLLPMPFIVSAERTGAAIFRKELNFARNRLLEEMSSMDTEINPLHLLTKVYTDYPMPIKANVDFTRQLEAVSKGSSFISREYPEILEEFTDIIGGSYIVTKNEELYYQPKKKKVRLTMDESSSAVRSLLDIGFFLRHVAKPGDILMIDEPELNLHPENQRRVARLFARLINVGIKVFITTHSDYIIKELNTLIMLHRKGQHLETVAAREGYKPEELIDYRRVFVYIAEEALIQTPGKSRKSKRNTLVSATVDAFTGIEARSFDDTIETMNRIQEEIIWGVE